MKTRNYSSLQRQLWLLCLLCLLTAITQTATAQTARVTGTLADSTRTLRIDHGTVQLFRADSTFVGGALGDSLGRFALTLSQPGNYYLSLSAVGYATTTHPFVFKGRDLNLGTIAISAEAITLDEATITATPPKMTVSEDTVIYHAAAYRVPDGSAVEALIEQLPGAEIDDDGNITINGQVVKKIRIDGKDFTLGGTKAAMKNLPAAMIEKVKAYTEKSDMAKLTGIDDGEEETVLDFGIRPNMRKGLNSNTDVGYGTEHRYGLRNMTTRMKGNMRYAFIGNANNTNDQGFSGRRRRGGGNQGQSMSKALGINLNYERRNIIKTDGSLEWVHDDTDNHSHASVENFVRRKGAFSNSQNQSYGRSDRLQGNMRVEWHPDTLTTINVRPNFALTRSDNQRRSLSASFNENPYDYTSDPLANLGLLDHDQLLVNSRSNKNVAYSYGHSLNLSLQLHRRLSRTGRSLGLSISGNQSNNHSLNLSATNVHLYLVQNRAGEDSTYQTNRYNVTPTDNWGYSLRASYTEPILRNTFLQVDYTYGVNHSKSDRQTYNFGNTSEDIFNSTLNAYRDWDSYFHYLDYPLDHYIDSRLSRYSEYTNYNHNINLQLRVVRQKYNFNAGIQLRPQQSHYLQDYRGIAVDTVRHLTNMTPTLNFRYRFDRRSDLRITYRGQTSQPRITDLLDITDDTNPLNITKGNPGLKPSFRNRMDVQFKKFRQRRQQTITANMNFSTTSNSISRMVTYDEQTGGRTTRPENINGNWNIAGGATFNTSLDTLGRWNLNLRSNLGYNHDVGYVAVGKKSSEKNVTRRTNLSQRLAGSYKTRWIEVSVDGQVNYNRSRNTLQPRNNMDTWRYSYGGNLQLNSPWGTSLSSGIRQYCRRGFSDAAMNTNELIWNAQISQSLLRGRPLIVMLQLYDILGQQSNLSRTINATRRSDTEYNTINSYAMLHVSYRLNMFGGKVVHQRGRNNKRR